MGEGKTHQKRQSGAEWGTESSGTGFRNLRAVQTVPGTVAAAVDIH